MLCPRGTKESWGALGPVATPWAGLRGPALGNQMTQPEDPRLSRWHFPYQEFSGGTCDFVGAWGAGRGRGKYIFKDNLEANIIFILIYPQSSLSHGPRHV